MTVLKFLSSRREELLQLLYYYITIKIKIKYSTIKRSCVNKNKILTVLFQCLQRQKENSKFETLPLLTNGFIEILGELYNHSDLKTIEKNELKAKYSRLNLEYKNVFVHKKEKTKISENIDSFLDKQGWMSHGIWNELCLSNFEGSVTNLK